MLIIKPLAFCTCKKKLQSINTEINITRKFITVNKMIEVLPRSSRNLIQVKTQDVLDALQWTCFYQIWIHLTESVQPDKYLHNIDLVQIATFYYLVSLSYEETLDNTCMQLHERVNVYACKRKRQSKLPDNHWCLVHCLPAMEKVKEYEFSKFSFNLSIS